MTYSHTSVIFVSVWSWYGLWIRSGSHLFCLTDFSFLSLNFGIEQLHEDWLITLQGWNVLPNTIVAIRQLWLRFWFFIFHWSCDSNIVGTEKALSKKSVSWYRRKYLLVMDFILWRTFNAYEKMRIYLKMSIDTSYCGHCYNHYRFLYRIYIVTSSRNYCASTVKYVNSMILHCKIHFLYLYPFSDMPCRKSIWGIVENS